MLIRYELIPPKPVDKQREAIAAAARELDQLRNNWLNAREWTRQKSSNSPAQSAAPGPATS